MNYPLIIALDFDGTLARHKFPGVGEEIPGAVHWCKLFYAAGGRLILWTCRCDNSFLPPDSKGVRESTLGAATRWCRERDLPLWGVNENPSYVDAPRHTSPKIVAHLYIDDRGLGVPLIHPMDARPYVDWERVGPAVMEMLCGS